jgi:hypothetical protein
VIDLPPYPDTTILIVEVGSTAHGTGLPGHEDHDETVIWMEPPAQVFALRDHELRATTQRTQPEGISSGPQDTDRMLYSVRRFLTLASSGNPSILLVLWAPIIRSTEAGDSLRELAPAFVGRHLVARYRGYMQAQVDRLLGLRGGRHGRFRDDNAGYDTKYAMHAARLGYQGIELLTTGKLVLPVGGESGEWLRAVRRGEISQEDWASRVQELDRRLAELAEDRRIAAKADRARIVAWSADAHLAAWSRSDDLGNG